MKNYIKIALFVFIGLFAVSCNQKQLDQQEKEIASLNQEVEELRQVAEEKESSLNEFFESMSQIRDNLNEIKVRQNLISEETKDSDNVGEDVQAQIQEDLKVISNLMEENRRKLAGLNRQLRDSNVKVEEFENMVASLNTEIENKNVEISLLSENLHQLNISNENLASVVNKLEEENTDKLQVIEEKTEQLNTAYYIFGTQKELRDQEIIDKEGGLLGLGRTTVVKSDLNKEYFSRIDISQIEKVFIPGTSPDLLSLHPNGSYIIETNEEEDASIIFIENPKEFWSNTRYLIVSVE